MLLIEREQHKTRRKREIERKKWKERNSKQYLRAIERKFSDDDKTNREKFCFLFTLLTIYIHCKQWARSHTHKEAHKRKHNEKKRNENHFENSVVIRTKIECDSIPF